MAPGGRVAILTFHSGEDRLVKKAFKALYKQGIFSEIAKDVIRPSAEECNMNPRARSTKMRWAIKINKLVKYCFEYIEYLYYNGKCIRT